MRTNCTCPGKLGECPTPYTCGIYHLQGQQPELFPEPAPRKSTWRDRLKNLIAALTWK